MEQEFVFVVPCKRKKQTNKQNSSIHVLLKAQRAASESDDCLLPVLVSPDFCGLFV